MQDISRAAWTLHSTDNRTTPPLSQAASDVTLDRARPTSLAQPPPPPPLCVHRPSLPLRYCAKLEPQVTVIPAPKVTSSKVTVPTLPRSRVRSSTCPVRRSSPRETRKRRQALS